MYDALQRWKLSVVDSVVSCDQIFNEPKVYGELIHYIEGKNKLRTASIIIRAGGSVSVKDHTLSDTLSRCTLQEFGDALAGLHIARQQITSRAYVGAEMWSAMHRLTRVVERKLALHRPEVDGG